jgi:hypothetical protein
MRRYEFEYKDGANYKHSLIVDAKYSFPEPGQEVTMQELGYTLDDFFERFIGNSFQKEIDHNILRTIQEVRKYKGIYIMVEETLITSQLNKALLAAEDWIDIEMADNDRVDDVYAVTPYNDEIIFELSNGMFAVYHPVGYKESPELSEIINAIDQAKTKDIKPVEKDQDTDKYIVCWMLKSEMNMPGRADVDHYQPYIEPLLDNTSPKEQATDFYNKLIEDPNTYTANLCKIVHSTDYF